MAAAASPSFNPEELIARINSIENQTEFDTVLSELRKEPEFAKWSGRFGLLSSTLLKNFSLLDGLAESSVVGHVDLCTALLRKQTQLDPEMNAGLHPWGFYCTSSTSASLKGLCKTLILEKLAPQAEAGAGAGVDKKVGAGVHPEPQLNETEKAGFKEMADMLLGAGLEDPQLLFAVLNTVRHYNFSIVDTGLFKRMIESLPNNEQKAHLLALFYSCAFRGHISTTPLLSLEAGVFNAFFAALPPEAKLHLISSGFFLTQYAALQERNAALEHENAALKARLTALEAVHSGRAESSSATGEHAVAVVKGWTSMGGGGVKLELTVSAAHHAAL